MAYNFEKCALYKTMEWLQAASPHELSGKFQTGPCLKSMTQKLTYLIKINVL